MKYPSNACKGPFIPFTLAALYLPCLIGCGNKPKPEDYSVTGLWKVEYLKPVSEVTQRIWKKDLLRIKPDGTFKMYGGIGVSGTYTRNGSQLQLKFTRIGYQAATNKAEFANIPDSQGMITGSGVPLPREMNLNAKRADVLELVDFAPGTSQSRVFWRIAPHENIAMLLDKFNSVIGKQDPNAFGDYVNDEVADRRTESVPVMIQILRNGTNIDRCYCAEGLLAHMKAKEAVPALISALYDPRPGIASGAARSLGEIGSLEATEPIVAALKSKRITEVDGASALSNLRDKRAVSILTKLADGNDAAVRKRAIELLVAMKAKEALPTIKKLLSDNDPQVRESAGKAVTTMGRP